MHRCISLDPIFLFDIEQRLLISRFVVVLLMQEHRRYDIYRGEIVGALLQRGDYRGNAPEGTHALRRRRGVKL
jgi:hypothetical protein